MAPADPAQKPLKADEPLRQNKPSSFEGAAWDNLLNPQDRLTSHTTLLSGARTTMANQLFILSSLETSLPYILPGAAAGLFLVSGHWTNESAELRLT